MPCIGLRVQVTCVGHPGGCVQGCFLAPGLTEDICAFVLVLAVMVETRTIADGGLD